MISTQVDLYNFSFVKIRVIYIWNKGKYKSTEVEIIFTWNSF